MDSLSSSKSNMSTLGISLRVIIASSIVLSGASLNGQFVEQAKLVANDFSAFPLPPCTCPGVPVAQGYSVALSADGNTMVTFGYGDNNDAGGAAWVFTRSNGIWKQEGPKLIGSGAVGPSLRTVGGVAISADGNTVILGRGGDNGLKGAVWVFVRDNGVWSQQGEKLVGSGGVGVWQGLGGVVALSADGNTAVADGREDNSGTGAIWVFTRSNGVWRQEGEKLVAREASNSVRQFFPVISADGNTVLFGSPRPRPDGSGNGFNWIFSRENGAWKQETTLLVSGTGGPVYQGTTSALSGDGNTALVGGYNLDTFDAYTWVFVRTASGWRQQGETLIEHQARYTFSPSFPLVNITASYDGNTAILNNAIWKRDTNGVWSRAETLRAPLGAVAMSTDGDTIVVGDPQDNSGIGASLVFSNGRTPLRGRLPRSAQ